MSNRFLASFAALQEVWICVYYLAGQQTSGDSVRLSDHQRCPCHPGRGVQWEGSVPAPDEVDQGIW